MGLLTSKQEIFVREYMLDHNATQAAIRAGYKPTNADVTGPRMLGNVRIQDAIAELERKAEAFSEKTAADVRAKLAAVPWSEDPGISMRDKLKALELYARYIGMDREAKQEVIPIFNLKFIKEAS